MNQDTAPAAQSNVTPGVKLPGPGEHVFNMHSVNQVMGGPEYSPVFGACVQGERMLVALMRYPAGKPSDAHSHPNEQWIFVMSGELEMEFEGVIHRAGAGDVIYVPANKIHKAANHGPEDVVFFTCKDTTHGLHGIKHAANQES